ncbi:arylsulfatase [Paenibacillus sp. H1-7]|uniref:arylsulfatase n=1 Tax=Paenibacillus sp. H1-7 TaxID=2282849 RepID=UPI001EF9A7F5|nr:arylsulfatase [Paenibacillus sp. H1-7]ULL16569.1 arylsulfatase [Paenibacillus sp. H1-7]
MSTKPNIIVILNDDMGYSDIGCYGGEIDTPNLNSLAENGIRFAQFYNTARCSPTRASLLTGLHSHQTGIGILVNDDGPEGYAGNLNGKCVTIAEVLRENNYRTYMSGKWHVATNTKTVNDTWPIQRGFDRFYGILGGAASYFYPGTLTRNNENIEHEAERDDQYYITDAISGHAAQFIKEHVKEHPDQPFFQYVAYTAPHWPLHAREEDIAKYAGRFEKGWDRLREERLERMIEKGLIDSSWKLTDRDPGQPKWDDVEDKAWQLRRMEVYAAQIDRMDQGIGTILQTLKETGQWENTIIFFLADNGGCAEELAPGAGEARIRRGIGRERTKNNELVAFGNRNDILPGAENTYQSYGVAWANLSNTPFRLYKHWVHEGGIATPLIVHWPESITDPGAIRHTPGQLTDIMATILEISGASYPATYKGRPILPLEGKSLINIIEGNTWPSRPLFWEHEGNAAVRLGQWKLVKKYPGAWELYDMETDRTETNDLAGVHPGKVAELSKEYDKWADRCGVIPRDKILALKRGRPSDRKVNS